MLDEFLVRQEALKKMLIQADKTMKSMRDRLLLYIKSPNVKNFEVDKREKELQHIENLIADTVLFIESTTEEITKMQSEIFFYKEWAKEFHKNWVSEIQSTIDMTNIFQEYRKNEPNHG